MISKLPGWVLVGGFLLAFIAGMANVVALLGFAHQTVSHLTATTSRLGISMAEGNGRALLGVVGVIGSFFAGAAFSGWLIRDVSLKLGRRYGVALLVEAFALATAVAFLQHQSHIGIGLLCFACGLQNGIASNFSGAVLRTTHMTGIFTDLGVEIGHMLRGEPLNARRMYLYSAVITGFAGGGAVSAIAVPYWHDATLLLPAGICVIAAALYHRVARHDPRPAPIAKARGTSDRRIRMARVATIVFIIGLVLSGLTAMPVQAQLDFAVRCIDRDNALGDWLWRVHDAIHQMNRSAPFLLYGYDWLAFGHIAIALAFVPAVRDPVKHRWLFDYGLVLCGLVVLWALCVGPFRRIPLGWRLIDCSFGFFGAIPLLYARKLTQPAINNGMRSS